MTFRPTPLRATYHLAPYALMLLPAVSVAAAPDWHEHSGHDGYAQILAALHGIPVYFLGVKFRSKTILIIAAVIASFVGIAIGNLRYAGLDLFAVGLACYIGWVNIDTKNREIENYKYSWGIEHPDAPRTPWNPPKNSPAPALSNSTTETKKAPETATSWMPFWITGVLLLCTFAYALVSDSMKKKGDHSSNPPPAQVQAETQNLKLAVPNTNKNPQSPLRKNKSDIRHCLSLQSNEAIAKCSERQH